MIRRAFQYHSGRVIAASRVALALMFLFAVWMDPAQPTRASVLGYTFFSSYFILSALLLGVIWHDWWLEYRLRLGGFLLDSAVFLVSVYFTESEKSDFVSPFMAFFTYLMLTTAIYWNWRATLIAAGLITAAYVMVGLAMESVGVPMNYPRFIRRFAYMGVLALFVAWFGLQERAIRTEPLDSDAEGKPDRGIAQALHYAIAQSGAGGGVAVWQADGETLARMLGAGSLGRLGGRIDAETSGLSRAANDPVMLFDTQRQRFLIDTPTGVKGLKGPVNIAALGECLDIPSGLHIPIQTGIGTCSVLVVDVPGLCAEHLKLGVAIAREIEIAFERRQIAALTRAAEVAKIRDSIARDLHDSVAQSLAGANFRIQAVRATLDGGEEADALLEDLQQDLRNEQRHVRMLIDRLRSGETTTRSAMLGGQLGPTLSDAARQWRIRWTFKPPVPDVEAPTWLVHELQQIVREAVANAARHGAASNIALSIVPERESLLLEIVDDGKGFQPDGSLHYPRSIGERVKELGATLEVASHEGRTRLAIEIPMEILT